MRYQEEHRTRSRQRIIEMAARRYQAEGIGAVGIANLMADLGMTHGGFYRHFADKEALVAETCRLSFKAVEQHWQPWLVPGAGSRRALVEDFLAHHPDFSSFASTLAGEISRRDHISRRAFTEGVHGWLAQLETTQGQGGPDDLKPAALLALMLGAQLLTRVISDPNLAQRIAADVAALTAARIVAQQQDGGDAQVATP